MLGFNLYDIESRDENSMTNEGLRVIVEVGDRTYSLLIDFRQVDFNSKTTHLENSLNSSSKQTVRKTKFPNKFVDDLDYMVNLAIVFSKLDIIKAFHQP